MIKCGIQVQHRPAHEATEDIVGSDYRAGPIFGSRPVYPAPSNRGFAGPATISSRSSSKGVVNVAFRDHRAEQRQRQAIDRASRTQTSELLPLQQFVRLRRNAPTRNGKHRDDRPGLGSRGFANIKATGQPSVVVTRTFDHLLSASVMRQLKFVQRRQRRHEGLGLLVELGNQEPRPSAPQPVCPIQSARREKRPCG